jgi:hypothetical protein
MMKGPDEVSHGAHANGVVTVNALTPALLRSLQRGEIATGRVPDVCEQAMCARCIDEIPGSASGRYDPANYASEAYRFGPTLNEHRDAGALRDDYWHHVDETLAMLRSFTRLREVRRAFLDLLRRAWPGPVQATSLRGRELF